MPLWCHDLGVMLQLVVTTKDMSRAQTKPVYHDEL